MASRDWFADIFGRAIADIRQKVVEEPWFGRPVTKQPLHPTAPGENAREQDRPPEQDHEHGIDR